MAKIISASRRTDVPRFFGRWFAERRKAGVAEFRNAFGGKGSASLSNDDVLGFLFWTKYAGPFHGNLGALRNDGIPYSFQYTITGYGKDLEPNIPELQKVIEDLHAIRENLPSSRCIQWRYDPIVVSDSMNYESHLKRFEAIASELEGTTEVVNISFVEPYLKAIRRIDDPTVTYRPMDPKRHKTAFKRYPNILQHQETEVRPFLDGLSKSASKHGMELRACANPEWALTKAQCCSAELFLSYGSQISDRLSELSKSPSRPTCQCLESVDIGMDNSCIGGCKYCYVVTSQERALESYRTHDQLSTSIR